MDDVVIVGGGIIGTATAYFLSKEGRKVKVIETKPPINDAEKVIIKKRIKDKNLFLNIIVLYIFIE